MRQRRGWNQRHAVKDVIAEPAAADVSMRCPSVSFGFPVNVVVGVESCEGPQSAR
jgi:hypothetical protein